MSFETGVAWYDALPGLDLTQCDTPSDRWRRLFWSAQIAKTRGAARPGHVASLHALACTLLIGYRCGLGPECLSESLGLLRDLHGRGLGLARWTLDFGEALFAEHERTGTIEPIQEMVQVYEEAQTTGKLGSDVRCQLAKALIARGWFTREDADLSRAKCILDAIAPLLEEGSSPHFAVVSAMHYVSLDRSYKECDLENMHSLVNMLQEHLKCTDHWTQRCQMDLRAAYFAISAIIRFMTCSKDSEQGTNIANSALLRLHHESFAATVALSEFCIMFELFVVGGMQYRHSRQLVERLFHAAKGNSIQLSEAHNMLSRWMIVSHLWAPNDYINSLEIATAHYRQALALCPPDHIRRYRYLVGLSSSLSRLYETNGTRNALNEVITLFDRYADVARRVPPFAINVSSAMWLRAKSGRLRMDSKQALAQRAIQVLQDTMLSTPPSSRYHKSLLEGLSGVYLFQTTLGCSVDRTEHLAIARRSVAASLSEPSNILFQMQLVLARVLIQGAQQTHDITLLHEGIALLEHIAKEPLVKDLGAIDHSVAWLRPRSYMIRYKLLGANEDLEAAEAMFQTLCSNTIGDLAGFMNMDRLGHVLAWADAAHYAGQDAMEMRAYQHVVGMLSQLACLGLGEDISTRVEALQLVEGIACRAAVIYLTCGDIHGAIELLEQSRGVVWTQTLRLKTPFSSVPPEYADEFTLITGALKQTSNDTSDTAIKRRDSAIELDSLLERIRQVEGYERFLLPRLYTELATCTSHGFVVLVIPSDAVTDVLIMRSSQATPTHLRLPSIQLHRLQDWTAELKRSCDQSRDAVSGERMGMKLSTSSVLPPRDEAYMKLLRELWLEIVRPVLASLGIERREHDLGSRPRLWWCLVGPFAELPLHAAGAYRGTRQDCLANYVVSSYTPTLSALINAQSAATIDRPQDESNILLVSVPDAPGLPSLPNAQVEADRVRDIMHSTSLTTLSGNQACLESILKALPDVSVLHLASHGQQSQDNPLTSGFVLRDGRLTLKRLMELHLPHAELAYLSACETASTDEYQPDEAINLAATMLFVGFKSVIATMWSMDDLDGPFIAERVYRAVFRDGKLDLNAVPHALDGAVKELRESGAHPSRWATYVHIGA